MATKPTQIVTPQGERRPATCLFCGSTGCRFWFRGSDRWFRVAGEYDVYRCDDCGLVFLDPQPSEQQLAAHYPSNYYSFGGERADDERDERLYQIFYGRRSTAWKRLVASPYRFIVRSLPAGSGDRLLDVGCGSGHFLAMAKKTIAGLEAYGLEPYGFDAEFAARCGLTISNTSLRDAHYPDDFFDVITLNHVFEHLPDPSATLTELRRILKPGGRLVIGVPQSRSLLAWLFGRHWAQMDVPRHLFIPSTRNLREFAGRLGFRVRGIRYNSRPETILDTLFHWRNHVLRRGEYLLDYKRSRLGIWSVAPFAYLANWLRLGDQIEMFLIRR